jgi:hypothetical protein
MSNLNQEQARQKISLSIVAAISGLAGAAVLAVVLAPAFANRPQGIVWALIIAEVVFGASLVIGSNLLKSGSTYISEKTNKPLRAVKGAGTTVWSFYIFFLIFNGIMAFSVSTVSAIGEASSGAGLNVEALIQTASINAILVLVIYFVIVMRSETQGLKPGLEAKSPSIETE